MAGQGRFVWPARWVELFLEICVDEKHQGNLVGGYFTESGKANVMRRIHEKIHPEKLTHAQIRSKWDALKMDLRLWKELKFAATGLGYARGMIQAPKQWWNDRVQGKPKMKKFMKKPLEHEELLEELFGNVVATGMHAQTPEAHLYPAVKDEAENELPNNDNIDDDYRPEMAGVTDHHSTNDEARGPPVAPEPAPAQSEPAVRAFPQPRTRQSGEKRKGRGGSGHQPKRRLADGIFDMSESIRKYVSLSETLTQGHTEGATSQPATGGRSDWPALEREQRVFQLLFELPGIDVGTPFYNDCTKVLRKPELKIMFLAQEHVPKDKLLKWLEGEVNDMHRAHSAQFPRFRDDDTFPST